MPILLTIVSGIPPGKSPQFSGTWNTLTKTMDSRAMGEAIFNDTCENVPVVNEPDVLKYLLEGHCSVVVRSSGTEPELKTYISVSAENRQKAEALERETAAKPEEFFQ